jgi:hypothetical protein
MAMQLYFEERPANTFTATSDPGVPLVSTDYDHEIATGESETTSSILTRIPNAGSLPQKGIVYYGLAQNRQNPLAGTLNAAIFNTFRRTRGQILYWGVPLLIAYEAMQWAIEK